METQPDTCLMPHHARTAHAGIKKDSAAVCVFTRLSFIQDLSACSVFLFDITAHLLENTALLI